MLKCGSNVVNKLVIVSSMLLVFIVLYMIFYNAGSGNTENETNTYASCKLVNGSCHFELQNQQFLMTLSPSAPKPESQIEFAIVNKGKAAVKLSGFLSGKNMFMGKIPLFFKEASTDNSEIGQRLVAQTPIGSCTEEQMIWLINLKIKLGDDKEVHFTSEFTVYRD